MAISVDKVKAIQTQTIELGELILKVNPVSEKEWDAFEKLVGAHKNLMKIDTDSLLQIPLPFEPKKEKVPQARKDCPRCKGTDLYRDPASETNEARPCNCKNVEDVAWPQVKKEWEEALAPVEV